MSDPSFTTDQLAAINAACRNIKGFASRRLVEAIITLDAKEYNSFLVDAVKASPSRIVDLIKMLITSEKEAAATGKPSTKEVIKAAAEPLKFTAQ